LRFTVHRPPNGEVSLCWYRPSGGNVSRCVHVGVARAGLAGHTRKDRLALAVFGCDVPTSSASLRRVHRRDPFESSRDLVVEAGNQPTPPLTTDFTVEAPLLCHPHPRLVKRAARRASHRSHVEVLHPNGVEPARQVGGGLFHPITSPIGFARLKFGDGQLGSRSALRSMLRSREASLQTAQPGLFTGGQARGVQQLAGRQCHRDRHPAINTDHTAIARSRDPVGDTHEGDMPAPRPIPRDAIGLHAGGHGAGATEADPADLRHQHPRIPSIQFLDMTGLDPDLSKTFMHAGFAPRRTPMGAGEEVAHGLGKVAQRLLLHGLGSCPQPAVLGADLGQLRTLLVIPWGVTSGLPQLLLLDSQVPHKTGMAAMLHQHHLLIRCRQHSEPRHTRTLATTTDTNEGRTPARVGVGVACSYDCRGLPPKEGR
jgi:hypothetical protein